MIKKIKVILEMIKFEHTIFALPFAYMGAILGSFDVNGTWPTWAQIGWITVAMVGARSAAMALNRLIDRFIDASNPRTATRAIPAGQISAQAVTIFIIVSFAVLFLAAYQLNRLAVYLLPLAVFILVLYSYTKRFTWACHLVLGVAIGLAPLGGWVGTTAQVDWHGIVLFLLVAAWTAGFDVIYACQDVDFDRKEGLHSIPVRFGIAGGLRISKLLHILAVIGLVALYYLTPVGYTYLLGVLLAIFILIYEHSLVSPNDLSKLNTAFFTMNGVLSVVIFTFTLLNFLFG